MIRGAVMDTITSPGLYKLLTWLSPNFPVGAFAYSHGLEFAVETAAIKDAETLTRWVDGIITFGAGRVDASVFRGGWEAVMEKDEKRLADVSARADALRGTFETALESAAQGRAFLDTVLRVWPEPRLAHWYDELESQNREPAYAVAVGVASAVAGVDLPTALTAYLNAFAANLVSAGVRLVPLGQTDGQRTMAALEETIVRAVEATLQRAPDDLGTAALTVDWTSMQHETQYTRLFRS